MMHLLKVYAGTLFLYLLLDYIWLGLVASKFYKAELGELARRASGSLSPVMWAAAVVYVMVPLAIVVFVLPRVTDGHMTAQALGYGFFFGLIVYGVYDMTNYAILHGWTLKMSIIDIAWGGVVCALVSLAAANLDRLIS